MLVIDLHALETIDLLNLVEQMLLKLLRSTDIQNLMWYDGTFSKLLPFLHKITLEGDNVLGKRDEVLLLGAGLGIADDEFALAANRAADVNDTVDTSDFAGILGSTGFK